MDSILEFTSGILSAVGYWLLVNYFVPFKLKAKENCTLYCIILINILLIFKFGNISVVFLLVSVCIYIALIRENKVINMVSFIIAYLFGVVIDQIFSLLWNSFICPISIVLNDLLYYQIYAIMYIFLLALICPIISKYYYRLIEKIKNQIAGYILLIIISNLGMCLTIFLFNIIIGDYIGYNSKIIGFNCILFGCYFVITTILVVNIIKANVNQMEMKKRQEVFHDLQKYTAQIERMYSSLRFFKHDYSNLMITISGYIEADDMKGLQNYFENNIMPLNEKMIDDNARLNQIMNLKNTEIKSIISAKLFNAMESKVSIVVEVLEEIDIISMDSVDLARVLGIFLDNAIESAKETEHPKIQFAAIHSEMDCVFIIKNTFVDKGVTISSLKQPDVSTKGSGRGIGLFIAQEIVAKYKNIYWDTEIEEEYFLQRLRIVNNI